MKKSIPKEGLIAEIQKLADPVAGSLGVTVQKIELVKEGGSLVLRFILEKASGVSIEDCEKFSRGISKSLDQVDIIEENYYLEVSSPGI